MSLPKSRPEKSIGPYDLVKTIGQGSTGKVKLAIHQHTHEKKACKIMLLPECMKQSTADQEPIPFIAVSTIVDIHKLPKIAISQSTSLPIPKPKDLDKAIRMVKEASLMLILEHPFIAQLHEIFIYGNFIYFMFEHVSGGQMLDYIISHGRLKEKQARKFFRQIMSAVDYCHENSIVHRDLKIENILIDEYGSIKLIDFGLSNIYTPESHLKTYCGSLYFAAPELLSGILLLNMKVTQIGIPYTGPEVDIWSMGIILYVLLCGKVPFDDPQIPILHSKIKAGLFELPNHLSLECKLLLKGMLNVDSSKRYTLDIIKQNTWVNKGYTSIQPSFVPKREKITQFRANVIDIMQDIHIFQNSTHNLSNIRELLLLPLEVQKTNSFINIYHIIEEKLNSIKLSKKLSELRASTEVPGDSDPLNLHYFDKENLDPIASKAIAISKVSGEDQVLPYLSYASYSPAKTILDYDNTKMKDDQSNSNFSIMKRVSTSQEISRSLPTKSYFADRISSLTNRRKSSSKKHNSILSNNGRADECIQSVSLKGLFSVANTSILRPSAIRENILRVMNELHIQSQEHTGGFECKYQNLPNTEEDESHVASLPRIWNSAQKHAYYISKKITSPTFLRDGPEPHVDSFGLMFDINIVRIPFLGLHGIQFRRISGDAWEYKLMCTKILKLLKL